MLLLMKEKREEHRHCCRKMRLDAVWHMPKLGAPQLPLDTYLKDMHIDIMQFDTVGSS